MIHNIQGLMELDKEDHCYQFLSEEEINKNDEKNPEAVQGNEPFDEEIGTKNLIKRGSLFFTTRIIKFIQSSNGQHFDQFY